MSSYGYGSKDSLESVLCLVDFEYKESIASQLVSAECLSGITKDQLISSIEPTTDQKKGNYSIMVAKLNKYKKLNEPPVSISNKISQEQVAGLIKSSSSTGPYANFFVDKSFAVEKTLKEILEKNEDFGKDPSFGESKTVIVEYSSPNIAKPFHAGHLRSTILGNFLVNSHKALGFNVVGINYLGDWGKQYGLLAFGYGKYGSEEKLKEDPIKHLYDVYVQVNKDAETDPSVHQSARDIFSQMEQGEETSLHLWKRFRDLSIDAYVKIYERLGVSFDVYSGESSQSIGMTSVLKDLEERELLVEDNGAYVIDLTSIPGPPSGKQKKPSTINLQRPVIKKSDGSTLYITRDLAAAIARWNTYKFHKMFYVVSSQQDLHFQQLFQILKMMGHDWAHQCQHINFGMVNGMSTRKGQVVFLEDILNDSKEHMLEAMMNPTSRRGSKKEKKEPGEKDKDIVARKQQQSEQLLQEMEKTKQEGIGEGIFETADIVGMSAVFVQDMSARRIRNYQFDMKRMTDFEGYTGPYLQYAHARLCGIERKCGIESTFLEPISKPIDFSLLSESEAEDLILCLGKFPSAIAISAAQGEPCLLVGYLFELSKKIAKVHEKLQVKGVQDLNVATARLCMIWAARTVLGNGMKILGLKPVMRM